MTTGGPPTAAQIARLAGGDRDAWSSVFRFLQPALDGYFLRQGMREPEDLTSEVFMRMSRNIHRFTSGGIDELRAWAFTIARTVRVDAIRRAAARPDTVPESATAGSDAAGDTVITRTADPAAQQSEDQVDDRSLVESLLDELTPQQREIISLRIFGDMTIEQCAEALDMNLGQAKQLHRRALRKLATLVPS